MKYKIGDVITFKYKRGLFMSIICIWNLIKYKQNKATHAGIITSIEDDKIWISEAIMAKGKDFKEYEYSEGWLEAKKSEGVVHQLRPIIKVKDIKKNAEKYTGSYYDWLSIILMPFKISFDSTKLVFCSEVVGRILYDSTGKKLNIAGEFGIDYEKVTPMHLYLSEQLEMI